MNAALRVYKAMIHLYPPRFRAEYGGEMLSVFRDAMRAEQRRRGARGLLSLWLLVLPDLAFSALREHAMEDFATLRAWLVRALAVSGLAGGALLIAFSLAAHARRPGIIDGPYRNLDGIEHWLLIGLACMAACLSGAYMRWSPRWSGAARIAGLLAVGGAAWPPIARLATDDFLVFITGYLVMIGSLLLTGILLVRQTARQPCAWLLLIIGCSTLLFNTEDERVLFAAVTGSMVLALSLLLLAGPPRGRLEDALTV